MSDAAKFYQKTIHNRIQRLATWEPGDAVAVGELGVLHNGNFRRVTTLADLGIAFEVEKAGITPHRSLTSISGVQLRSEAGGELPRAGGRVLVGLQQAGAVLFEAARVQQERFANSLPIIEQLRERRERDDWDRSWVLIDQVWRVGRGTVIVATDDQVELALTLRGDSSIGLAALAEGIVEGEFELRRGDVYKLLGARNFTPMYSAWTFGLWGRVKYLSLEAKVEPPLSPPPSLSIDDLLDSWDPETDPGAVP
jgi:hypothetical protein